MSAAAASKESDRLEALTEKLIKSLLSDSARMEARRGRYDEAERLLAPCVGERGDAADLLLLGKIYAQQGRAAMAIAQFERVLDQNSESLAARAAILKIKEELQVPSRVRSFAVAWMLPELCAERRVRR